MLHISCLIEDVFKLIPTLMHDFSAFAAMACATINLKAILLSFFDFEALSTFTLHFFFIYRGTVWKAQMKFDHVFFTFCLSHISIKLPKQNIVYMGWDLCLLLRV